MKKFLIYKKIENGYGEKIASYEAEQKDDSSSSRSWLLAEPQASHFELPEGAEEDCVDLVWLDAVEGVNAVTYVAAQPEKWTKEGEEDRFQIPMVTVPIPSWVYVPATEEQPEKWTKEGEEDSFTEPMITVPDLSWYYVPATQEVLAVEGVEAKPARWGLVVNFQKVAAKTQAAQNAYIDQVLSSAIAFGSQLMRDFTKENMLMGITQDGMTGSVRKNMIEVISALQTGSLYDAIAEAKIIPLEKKDAKYITDERLLDFVNKIEEYLGINPSASLED